MHFLTVLHDTALQTHLKPPSPAGFYKKGWPTHSEASLTPPFKPYAANMRPTARYRRRVTT
jgi:hypothetical protein